MSNCLSSEQISEEAGNSLKTKKACQGEPVKINRCEPVRQGERVDLREVSHRMEGWQVGTITAIRATSLTLFERRAYNLQIGHP